MTYAVFFAMLPSTPLDSTTNTQWSTVKTELNTQTPFTCPECNCVLLSRGYDATNAFGYVFWKSVASW